MVVVLFYFSSVLREGEREEKRKIALAIERSDSFDRNAKYRQYRSLEEEEK